ncbi:MAG: cbb3-type cytochrome c oxidase subunit I, partial [Acidimicrobiales bacterium]|nr:cbb3-type cytochrome c oxidase subunit I [Acidimicrobiales bacterium]
MTALVEAPTVVPSEERGLAAWVTATDHKRIALMTLGTALLLFLAAGLVALVMRAQLAQPNQHLVPTQTYNQLFTLHGSVMIYLFVTPVAIAMGLYLVPLQVGAPMVAAPKLCLASFWVYLAGSVSLLFSMIPATGGASAGWYAYTPLSDSQYSPGVGMDLWLLGVFLAVLAMMAMAGAVLWTALRMRAPGMTLLRMPVFTWSMVVTCLMTVASFPSLLAAVGLVATGRADPTLFHHNLWDVAY